MASDFSAAYWEQNPDALLVLGFGLPVQGQDSSPWILDHLNLPEDLVPRLQRVLMALKPVHQAVAMAAICHPGISKAQATELYAQALEVGVTAAMRLETVGLERDQASLARLACLISELGSLSKTQQNQPDPIAQALGIVVDQADTRGTDAVDSSGSIDTSGADMSGETRAHPLTVYLLADLLERFAQIDPQDGGRLRDLLYVDGGPASTGTVGHLRMAGNQVFRHAVVNIAEGITAACEAAGIEVADVDWFVPHQANQRIIKGVGDRLGLDENKVISTVALHANTSAASIPLALDAAIQDGRIKKGDMVLLEAMGGGLTWGACALRL